MNRNIYLIVICILLQIHTLTLKAQNEDTRADKPLMERVKIAYDSLYKNTNGAEWTINDFEVLKSRNKAPYIRIKGPAGFGGDDMQGYYFNIVDLCNNNLTGKITNKTWNKSEDYSTKSYTHRHDSKWYFSHNKITSIGNITGYTKTGFVKELCLDNNLITAYTTKSKSGAIPWGFHLFTLHQNDVNKLKASDFHFGGFYYIFNNTQIRLIRIDNNRLDFASLCNVVPVIKKSYSKLSDRFPGNPNCVFDYYPQKPLGGNATSETLAEGTDKTLNFSLTHPQNIYSWQLNGKDVPISTTKNYTFKVNAQTAGVWRCKITNPNMPEVTLYSYDMAVFMEKSGNKAASDITISQSTLANNFPENAIVADFSATDPDGDELFYRLPDRTADNSHFRIINGKTLVSSEILFEKEYIENYTIEVEVYDRFGGIFKKEFTITKNGTSGSQLPSDILLSNNIVEENSADKIIGTLSAKGVDGYSFILADNEGDNNMFKIVGNDLKTIDAFNYEKKNRYSIRVTASAADGTSIKKDFDIDVTDVNDNPHDIILTSTQLKVNTPAGTVMGFITAIDEDKTDKLFTFEIDQTLANNSDFFFEDNIIKAKKVFTKVSSKQITIKAKDDENAEFVKTFDITIVSDQAVTNRPPRGIGITNSVISHNLEAGAKIADIYMSDPDGDAGTFSCDNKYIEVDGSALKLKIKPESNSPFEITLKGSDGDNEIEQKIKIYVTKEDGATEVITVGNSNVKIYPNPAQSHIHINGIDYAKYSILDLSGVVVKTSYQPSIYVDDLKSGYYIIKIETEKDVITRRFIKK